jgi:polyisoprenoid-binding protein YceI
MKNYLSIYNQYLKLKTMKNLKTIAIALVVAFTTMTASAQNKKIDVAKSNIAWVGKKVTGQHSGTIKLTDGILVFKGKALKGGTFNVDMTSITVTDLKAGEGKEKLEGHLKADDFFGTDNFKTAKLEFKLISDNGDGTYNVTANMTIKDQTNPVTFKITVKGNTATTSFKVDRTKYGIKYGSASFFDSIGDKAISDEFELTVNLVF